MISFSLYMQDCDITVQRTRCYDQIDHHFSVDSSYCKSYKTNISCSALTFYIMILSLAFCVFSLDVIIMISSVELGWPTWHCETSCQSLVADQPYKVAVKTQSLCHIFTVQMTGCKSDHMSILSYGRIIL